MERFRRCVGFILTIIMVTTLLPVVSENVKADSDITLSNPRMGDGVAVYDCIYFGNYWQTDTNGDGKADKNDDKTPIKWRVLSVEGNDAFLLADQILDIKEYDWRKSGDAQYKSVTWEKCSIREWLNSDFYDDIFDSREKTAVKETYIENKDNPYQIDGGEDTKDKIFLLSFEDIAQKTYGFDFFDLYRGNVRDESGKKVDDKAKYRKATDFAKEKWPYYNWEWWLRSPGNKDYKAAYVWFEGSVTSEGDYVSDEKGVCPALHIDLSDVSLYQDAGTVECTTKYDYGITRIEAYSVDNPLTVGQSTTINTTVLPYSVINTSVRYASSNPAIATVDSTGKVTAISTGTATITVTSVSDSTKKATVTITVKEADPIAVTGVSATATKTNLAIGEQATISTVVTPANATNKSVAYTSSNPSVAAVDSTGKVTAVSAGTAVVTVKSVSDSTKKSTITFTVKSSGGSGTTPGGDAGSGITPGGNSGSGTNPGGAGSNIKDIDKLNCMLGKHKEVIIPKVDATCSSDGCTEGKYCSVCGKVIVEQKVIEKLGHEFSSWENVRPASVLEEGLNERHCIRCSETETESISKLPATVKVNKEKVILDAGKKTTIKVGKLAEGDSVVSWKSSNTKIATVKNGVITAKKSGRVTITLKLASGKTKKITIIVNPKKEVKKQNKINNVSQNNTNKNTNKTNNNKTNSNKTNNKTNKNKTNNTNKKKVDEIFSGLGFKVK